MSRNKFASAFVAMTVAATVAACGSGVSAEPDPLASLKQRDAEQRASVKPSRFLPPNADLTSFDDAAFRKAMDEGKPYIYGIRNAGTAICETGVVIPGQVAMGTWFSNRGGAALIAGQALSREARDISGCSGKTLPGQVPDSGDGPDKAAQAAAKQAGVPFMYSEPGQCDTVVVLPDGSAWYLNKGGPASPKGAALSPRQTTVGCSGGYSSPGRGN